jgi:hypothetical protein
VNSTDAILSIAVEGLAVGLFTLIASSSNEAGSIVVTFMIGLWMIWLISNAGVVSRFANAIGNINNLAK